MLKKSTNREVSDRVDDIWRIMNSISNTMTFTGLLQGNMGVALFYSYYLKVNQSENVRQKLDGLLSEILTKISQTDQTVTLATGFTGYCWLVYHLIDLEILDEEDGSIVEEVVELVENSIKEDFANNNFDLFYGYIGKAQLFQMKGKVNPSSSIKNVIKKTFHALNEAAVVSTSGATWNDHERDIEIVNIGLAHGVPSIIAYLTGLYENNIIDKTDRILIENAVSWLLSQETNIGNSCFGTSAGESVNPHDSRLAWCYGDLGIACVLARASKILDRKDWMQKAITLGKSASQRDLASSYINWDEKSSAYDIHFCHGTSGVTYLFHKLYRLTECEEFYHAQLKWLDHTITNLDKLMVHYEVNEPQEQMINGQMTVINELGLLEGLSGVGLVLIALLDEELQDWDKIFLLS